MDESSLYISKIMFKNQIYKYEGQQFEDLFVSILSRIYTEFQAVKAYGSIGDQKNDGFDMTTGTYYQIFGPEDINKPKTIQSAVTKLEKDFVGLVKQWDNLCKIKVFNFVINDKYKGVPSPIIQKCLELGKRQEYKDITLRIFKAVDLEREFEKLNEIQVQDIVGFIPTPNIELIKMDALKETVDYLLNKEMDFNQSENLSVPDFNSKIKFNDLGHRISNLLMTGSYQVGGLEDYFKLHPGVNSILQEKFSGLYLESQKRITDEVENTSDTRFMYILNEASPQRTTAIQSSVLVLMSYYFSSCDIFEEPIESEEIIDDIAKKTSNIR
ncbi:ABC-three component system protein [Lactococcus lactis]|uniref:ABC-three component systems C-terminal domain-containing protein n=1 Tax=Lactococcus lactis subsp. lactis TaxID=1360 RepID=A0A2N5WBZ9_LACLL|nr:ABC-three component system protein [Lactococcus lactis]PLW59757.1 hypothetical protein CYU10_000648 [Lactococcus lactis subsp. lactis]